MKSITTMLGILVVGAMVLSFSGVTYAGISNGDPTIAQRNLKSAVTRDYGNSSWDKVVADTLSREPSSKIHLARYYGQRAYYGGGKGYYGYYGPYPKRKYYRQYRSYRNPYYGPGYYGPYRGGGWMYRGYRGFCY
jgi:hypothetical protein